MVWSFQDLLLSFARCSPTGTEQVSLGLTWPHYLGNALLRISFNTPYGKRLGLGLVIVVLLVLWPGNTQGNKMGQFYDSTNLLPLLRNYSSVLPVFQCVKTIVSYISFSFLVCLNYRAGMGGHSTSCSFIITGHGSITSYSWVHLNSENLNTGQNTLLLISCIILSKNVYKTVKYMSQYHGLILLSEQGFLYSNTLNFLYFGILKVLFLIRCTI